MDGSGGQGAKKVRNSGIEPEPNAWKASILPLD